MEYLEYHNAELSWHVPLLVEAEALEGIFYSSLRSFISLVHSLVPSYCDLCVCVMLKEIYLLN